MLGEAVVQQLADLAQAAGQYPGDWFGAAARLGEQGQGQPFERQRRGVSPAILAVDLLGQFQRRPVRELGRNRGQHVHLAQGLQPRRLDLDIEVAIPITQPLPPHERIQTRELSGGWMACVVYTGSYQKTPEVLNALLIWMQLHDYMAAGALREVYLRFGADHADALNLHPAFLTNTASSFVTELQLPVTKFTKENE